MIHSQILASLLSLTNRFKSLFENWEQIVQMKHRKMMHAYTNSEQNAVVESDNPHALIVVMYDELIRSMQSFCQNIKKSSTNIELRTKHFSKSLSVIYALQRCLDFEKGGEIAENLFLLYEHARVHLLEAFKSQNSEQVEISIKSLEEIREAWRDVAHQTVENS